METEAELAEALAVSCEAGLLAQEERAALKALVWPPQEHFAASAREVWLAQGLQPGQPHRERGGREREKGKGGRKGEGTDGVVCNGA